MENLIILIEWNNKNEIEKTTRKVRGKKRKK